MDTEQAPEVLQVQQWRYACAREAGLTKVEARLFAESEASLGELRKCVDNKWTPQQIARIVL